MGYKTSVLLLYVNEQEEIGLRKFIFCGFKLSVDPSFTQELAEVKKIHSLVTDRRLYDEKEAEFCSLLHRDQ